jgi:hypothetical protein
MSAEDDQTEAEEPVVRRSGEIGSWLSEHGYNSTLSECPDSSCEGFCWYDSTELVCGICGVVIDMNERRRSVTLDDPWDEFWNNRDQYNSGITRIPGGYPHAYEWDSSSEDRPRAFYSPD